VMTLDTSGNVSIPGAITTNGVFTVSRPDARIVIQDTDTAWGGATACNLNFVDSSGTTYGGTIGYNGSQDMIIQQRRNADMVFYTLSNERMRIDNSGDVTIGSGHLSLTDTINPQLRIEPSSGVAEIRHYVGGTLHSTLFTSASDCTLRTVSSIPLYLGTGNTNRVSIDTSGNVNITGALSKGSGSFDIPHVIPEKKKKNYRLRHYFVESNTPGDNIYRYQVEVKEDTVAIDLPDYFNYLNGNPQVWVTAFKHFGQAYGEVKGEQLIITANKPGLYNVLLIGTRKDEIAMRDFNNYGLEYIQEETDETPQK